MNVNRYDSDEREIQEGFARIRVNTDGLMQGVKSRMEKEKNTRNRVGARRALSLAAAVFAVLAISTTVFAFTFGGFERFVERFNPTFAGIVEPVMEYAEDQGIRMEVIGAQRFGDSAIVYLSIQDTTGQNRLTEDAWLSWGVGFASGGANLIYFDEETNKAYFEMNIEDQPVIRMTEDGGYELDPDSGLSDIFELVISQITFNRGHTIELFPVQPTDIGGADTMPHETWNSDLNKVLVPSRGENFPSLPALDPMVGQPYYEHSRWISNLAIIDGNLHVQLGTTAWAGSAGFVPLVGPDGEKVFPIEQIWFMADEDLQPTMSGIELRAEDEEYQTQYSFSEIVFPINVDKLAYYSLEFWRNYEFGVVGHWAVTVHTDDTSDQIRMWEGNVAVGTVGNFVVETMVVNPLGVRLIGSFEYTGAWITIGENVFVEIPDGLVATGTASGWHSSSGGWEYNRDTGEYEYPELWTFDIFSTALSPIDVASVTAVIVDGVRIELE
ncbi:MAG: hypothetical protein FWC93_06125 [Defluviitaleaceae bacterium]|nr:hypothetical protein [Defluviitaleaceae bacterium]